MCDVCLTGFEGYTPLKLTVIKSGSNVLVYAENRSRSIILIKRIILCLSRIGTTFLYLRKENFIVGDQIEQGTTYLMYSCPCPTGYKVQAEAEFIEFAGRSISKCIST